VGDQRAVCVVFMPMLQGYEGIRAAVREAIESAGATMRRLEELLPDAKWQLWVDESIEAADLVLADVTDNNAFVMYELGVTHAHRTPSLLIVNRRNRAVPATVKGSFFLPYDESHLLEFMPRLTGAIRRSLSLPWRTKLDTPTAEIYAKALNLLASIPVHTVRELKCVTRDEFWSYIEVGQRRGEIPAVDGDLRDAAEVLLARLVKGSDCCQVMDLIERCARANRAGDGE
jgi:hypothetical protein